MSLRALVIEDHPVMRYGVRHLICQEWPDCEIAEAASLDEGLRLAPGTAWDVALLDLSLGDSSGLEGLMKLRRVAPAVPVLILSMHDEEAYAMRALQTGAAGYLTKEHATTELLSAIRAVRAGGRYLSSGFAGRVAAMLAGGGDVARQAHEALSAQEYRVMVLIASGKAPAEIARIMHLSAKTVGTYRARIREKTGLATTADITRYCLRHGLIESG